MAVVIYDFLEGVVYKTRFAESSEIIGFVAVNVIIKILNHFKGKNNRFKI